MKFQTIQESMSVKSNPKAFDLVHMLSSIGGWRGLFDPFADEWKRIPVREKLEKIEEIKTMFECNLKELVYIYIKDCITSGNLYRIDAVPVAILDYSAFSEEAEQYYANCQHPALVP
jgi:hypothetical protein